MRTILTLLIMCFTISVFAQEDDINLDNLYYFNSTLDLTETNGYLAKATPDALIKNQYIVKVLRITDDDVEFSYLPFEKQTLKDKYNNRTFSLSKPEFAKLTNEYFGWWRKWKVGAYTIPFRIRSKKDTFEVESDLSLGANLIKGINFSNYRDIGHIDLSVGIALTKINLTESNSKIKEIDEDLTKLSESALTFSFGAMFNLTKNVNAGIFYGWDFLDGVSQKKVKWRQNKKPWIGFGINVSFKEQEKSESGQKSQTGN